MSDTQPGDGRPARLRVGMYWAASCGGCDISLLEIGEHLLELIEAADVVLGVGCRFAHRSTRGLMLKLDFKPEQALIHLDIDPTVIGLMHKPRVGIVGDAKTVLRQLVEEGRGAFKGRKELAWIRQRIVGRCADIIRMLSS